MVPREVTAPVRRRTRVIQRRRRIFTRLLTFVLITLAAGFVPAVRWMWFVNLAADAALGLYIWRLIQLKQDDGEARPATLAPAAYAQPIAPRAAAVAPSVIAPSAPPTPHAAPAEIGDDVLALLNRTRTG